MLIYKMSDGGLRMRISKVMPLHYFQSIPFLDTERILRTLKMRRVAVIKAHFFGKVYAK